MVTKDHVIPQCLFSRPYPSNLITVPACDACNNVEKSADDTYLRDYIVVDISGSESRQAKALLTGGKLTRAYERNQSVLLRQEFLAGHLQ